MLCTIHFTSYMLGLFFEQFELLQQAKHSSSAVEVTECFSQVRKIWLQLAWPDSAGAFIFITRLTDVSTTFYVHTSIKTCADSFSHFSLLKKLWNCIFVSPRISAARLCATQKR